ncbi:DUF3667 domain-containing protein [Massilia yuzhufengensis]|uniref:DUF3667 domain-containing protein n=1 Tax=Massilia yuzhufengensis TaxID=1164594 RepID=A0A1I1RV41_9BURK|nr:DUF3667 domain-containing protein [Massilia yuzhufengensis]SFD38115.1 Protein of unknown function [Massilia yuzhufengensis]
MTTEALALHQHASHCKNCDATTSGNFCPQCGQATHLHVPSAREFLHEFLAHYVAIEGKLWQSLKLLLFKPGLLTREYIEGRRVRYVEPLRLYLSFSIIFFALIKFSGVEIMELGDTEAPRTRPAVTAPATAVDATLARTSAELSDSERQLVAQAGELNPRVGKGVERFLTLPGKQKSEAAKRAFFAYAPYAIFLLMPVFALYLKVLYLGSRRRYGEHFLFALHSNAFAFLMLSLFIATPGSWDFLRLVFLVWLTFYLPTAMRRVYGGSRTLTALRWIALMLFHLSSVVATVVAVVGVALFV